MNESDLIRSDVQERLIKAVLDDFGKPKIEFPAKFLNFWISEYREDILKILQKAYDAAQFDLFKKTDWVFYFETRHLGKQKKKEGWRIRVMVNTEAHVNPL